MADADAPAWTRLPTEQDIFDKCTEGQAIDTTHPAPRQGMTPDGNFAPRNGLGRGRRRSYKHKLSEKFIRALFDDFKAHGADVIETVRREDPSTYLRTVAAMQPREMTITVNPLEELTDDQLRERLEQLETAVAGYTAPVIDGTFEPSSGEKAEIRH